MVLARLQVSLIYIFLSFKQGNINMPIITDDPNDIHQAYGIHQYRPFLFSFFFFFIVGKRHDLVLQKTHCSQTLEILSSLTYRNPINAL